MGIAQNVPKFSIAHGSIPVKESMMKTVRLLLTLPVALLLTSCFTGLSVLPSIPREEVLSTVDFTKYAEEGFLVSAESLVDPYEPIGMMKYTTIPSAEYRQRVRVQTADGYTKEVHKWVIETIDYQEQLDRMVAEAKAMGADAIIDVKIYPTQRLYSGIKNPVNLEGYEISGYAVKRNGSAKSNQAMGDK